MGWRFEPGFGRIWWYRAGELRLIVDGLTIPNAISFSPDGGTAYFSDTTEHVIYRLAVDPLTRAPERRTTGVLQGERAAAPMAPRWVPTVSCGTPAGVARPSMPTIPTAISSGPFHCLLGR